MAFNLTGLSPRHVETELVGSPFGKFNLINDERDDLFRFLGIETIDDTNYSLLWSIEKERSTIHRFFSRLNFAIDIRETKIQTKKRSIG